jgi:phage shock protein PspC (stress-responsive transcriptional regulator)
VFIKVLYVVFVLCTIALVGAVVAAYLKVRKHMHESDKRNDDKNYPGTPSGS